ncbi:non-ribosomal peptide synthetase [Bacillus velezensis]|uniref:non-ribosomal peptide synthetase n=1 Tax=Bacillus velezensis TaxID=492670 RepID=UPI002151D8C7|nr:non-ribosomal peptide synthetase [Bacillus velezensis]UUY40209.1 amino acid adenylation domain-containing protein [Bacillus velezensis]
MGQQPEIQDIYPLSFMQEGMLFHSLLDHDSRAYFEQAVFTINGQLDRERFQKSIDAVFERYDIFRTTFIHKNVAKPRQVVLKNRPSRVQFHDISHLDEKAQDKYADRFRKEDKDKGFDLQSDPLMRVSILKKAPERYVCIWSHHHIVMDGWCFGIVMKEFLMIYQSLGDGRLPSLEPVQPYGKYIKWLMKQDRKEAEIFWKTRLADLEQSASLPKKSAEPNGELEQAVFTISEEQTNELKNIAARAGATLNTVFQALWGILLQRVSRCDEAVFGSVVSGRPSDLAGVEKMVGLFINTIPVRVKSGSFSFLELVRHLQQETLQAEAYSYYPLYDIQAQSPLKQALFDHIIVFENVPAQREIENVSQAGSFDFAVEDFTMEEVTNYGCSIKVIPGNSLYIRLNFDTGIYDRVFMKNIETFLRHMMKSVISDPEMSASEIALLDACEARNMLDAFNRTEAVEPPAPTLHGLFARRAALSPHRPALRFPGGMLTYAELDQYTDRLAVWLRQKGVRKESMVGVLAERSPEMVVSVLAVLKAGGAYVPLDPEYPEDRLRYMLDDCGACLLLAQPGLSVSGFSGETLEVSLSALTGETETGAVSEEADSDSLAYIIYTSGSTGTPKGVAVEHRQAAAFLSGMQGQFPLTEEDIIVLKSSFSFDASIWQLFWWTMSGASVYLLPAGWEKDPVRMIEAFASEKVTTAHFIPAMVNSFLDALETEPAETRTRLGRTLTRVFAGGEALSPLTAARFADLLPETVLIHGYGPTEATVDAAFYVCNRKRDSGRTRLPIGKPVPGARLYVLDSGGTIQPAGVAGELYIAGTGVARGYLNRPELTEERFLDDPFYPGERMYQTGDIARWTEEGLVEWLGRSDGQVKVRGYRIEPGEIEAAIRRIDGIREAAVTARNKHGETSLYAYIEGRESDDVRAELATRLPAYMMPAQFIEMSEWPVTPSGKLDRRALPAPGGAADRQAYTAPRNVTEMKLCALWEEVLKNGPVGIREGELPVLELPADKPRPAVRSFAGGSVSCALDAETASGLHRIARDHGSTLYMVLLAAYNTLLARLSGQEDIIVGSPIAGRPHKDLEPILGMFVNTLAIRTEPKGDKRFTDYLAEVRQAALEAYEHQDYPFEELVERLGVQRDTSRNPLFDVMFVLQNVERESLVLNKLHLAQAADTSHKTAKFDATLYASEGSDGSISFDFEFNTDIYQKQTIEKWLSYFTRILTKVIENQAIPLGDIHVLDNAETNRVIYQFNQTKSDYPRHETISRLFERQAKETPDARAVVYDGQILTYRELNERANRIAAALRSNGVGPESVVALLTGRTTELASGILGILKAGGAYLPIGDDVPRERAEWMLKDCKADILLQSDKLDGLPLSGKRLFIEDIQTKAGLSSENPEPLGGPESLAYMIYTSGSTGAPKGVMIEQRSVIRLVKNSNYIDFTPEDRLLFTSSLGFDVTTFEIFGPLLNGASLYVSDQETYLDSDVLETFIQQNGITTLWLTSSLFNHLSEQNEHVFSGLSRLIIGGEALSPSHVNRVRNALPHLSVWNGYGPTENTTFSTCFLIEQSYDHSIPIGRPVGNSTAYIINSRGTPQPIGVIGELCTGGDGVARGYFGRPELTEEKFVPNPFVPGERMYRTGDLARWLPDGTIEYAGRMDDQVKIRGYRVELGEIEAALRSLDGVKEAAVSVRTGQSGNKELIAYMSLQADMDTEKVRSSLSKQLPNYMVPAYMMELEKLPLTPNGKLDRKNLPEPELALQTAYTAPRNELEEQLSVIWQEVLGAKQVGIEDSFFELGGDSIKALQVSARLGRYGWKMAASDLFRHPSIKELAPLIRKVERVIDQRPVEGDIPWTPVQHWFLSQRMENRNHFNQSVMMFSSDALHKQPLKEALEHLVIHHDALRITVSAENESFRQINHGIQKDELYSLDIWDLSETDTWEKEIESEVAALQQRMDIEKGPLLKAGWFKTRSGDYLFITVHHLAVDGVSWRILLEDLSAAYTQAVKGQPVQLPPKTDSFKQYAERLSEYAKSSKLMRVEEYWRFIEEETAAELPHEKPQHQTGADSIRQTVSFTLTEEETSVLLQQVNRAYHTDTQDILLTAAALALRDWTGGGRLRIAMEGHGREHIMPELDISRTVGWFTSMYPVLIDLNTAGAELGTAVKTVKDTLGRIPDKGIGYGILKYMTPPEQKTIRFRQAPEISFNYLGQFNDTEDQHTFSLSGLASGHDITPTWQREQAVEMSAMAAQNKLHFSLSYPPSRFRKETMEQLLQTLQQYLRDIMAHCTGKEEAEKTVSDFSSKTLTSDDLDSIASFVEEL